MTQAQTDFIWQGRVDNEEKAEDATRLHQLVQPFSNQQNGIAIIGFCSDEGVQRNKGRIGAAQAPNLIRKALANLPWDANKPVYDAGNIDCSNGDLEQAHNDLASQVADCLAQQHLPVVLGGGHEVAYGSWLGLITHLETNDAVPQVGIINFDAHFDLRLDTNGCSSGTPFYQIAKACESKGYAFNYCCLGVSDIANTQALFKRADSLGVTYLRDADMPITELAKAKALLNNFISQCDVLYLTIDLDVLPASEAPGVSAPAARGVGIEVLEPLIEQIVASGKLRLADMAEYNPQFDIDGRTARVAARLFHRITC
jgi:formiminoglutamase